jgi:hypothetical protein
LNCNDEISRKEKRRGIGNGYIERGRGNGGDWKPFYREGKWRG